MGIIPDSPEYQSLEEQAWEGQGPFLCSPATGERQVLKCEGKHRSVDVSLNPWQDPQGWLNLAKAVNISYQGCIALLLQLTLSKNEEQASPLGGALE